MMDASPITKSLVSYADNSMTPSKRVEGVIQKFSNFEIYRYQEKKIMHVHTFWKNVLLLHTYDLIYLLLHDEILVLEL